MKDHSTKICKKLTVGLLTAAVIVAGMFAVPAKADAEGSTEESIKDEIIYDSSYDMLKYWTADKKTAPVKTGYVFGGWYADEGTTPLTEETAAGFKGTSYAKFVPAYVLSVKAQNEKGVGKDDGTVANMRLMSSVDGKNYQNVGITVLLNNKKDVSPDEPATKVYNGIMVTGETEPRMANQIFGTQSKYMSVWRLNNIADANDSKIIYVRPYWTTPDGTKVEGLAKYVHVEDGYERLVSVPVNLMTDPLTSGQIAAGALQVTCTDDRFEVYGVETGRVLEEMDYNSTDRKAVKIVGNAAKVNTLAQADDIYANIRFKLKDGAEYEGGKGKFLKFTVTGENFCNWNEEDVAIDAWDVQY